MQSYKLKRKFLCSCQKFDKVLEILKMKEDKSLAIDEIDQENGEKVREVRENSNLKGDYSNVVILLFLYLLQGDDHVIFMKFELILR